MSRHADVDERKIFLIKGAKMVLRTIEYCIKNPYTVQGLYDTFKMGFLPVPRLMYCREEFPEAVRWQTKIRNGGVDIYDNGKMMSPKDRMDYIKEEVLPR